mgnify:CR=1 FL=1|tara:strand:+ start:744504 stop:746033 length:1530 start_codon:yes stop_codon:yes gene_type:complete
MPQFEKSLVWFRRDCRSFDHTALYHALKNSQQVYCAFIFDKSILDDLPRVDRRVAFLHASLIELRANLQNLGGDLIVRHAHAEQAIPALAQELGVDAVFVNHDYEPQAIARDAAVAKSLQQARRTLYSYKDHVIFEKEEILTQSGSVFSVFTPYKNAWLKQLHTTESSSLLFHDIEPYKNHFASASPASLASDAMPSLTQLGFEAGNFDELPIPTGMSGGQALLDDFLPRLPDYDKTRNFPAVKGPSYLSVHLRFGTVSIRTLARLAFDVMRGGGGFETNGSTASNTASSGAAIWLAELIWRDFYFMILANHPHVVHSAFKPAYDAIQWENGAQAKKHFRAWCDGETGYPLVDAGMRQLNQTGYMHNRLRMVTASFLIKDLGIDWRWGETYFAEKLNDFDLAANNGGWQWAASTGCDAQPYFRIFNPITQSERFDSTGKFIRRYVPEIGKLADKYIHAPWRCGTEQLEAAGIKLGKHYPPPLVQHEDARVATLSRYAVVKTPRIDKTKQ